MPTTKKTTKTKKVNKDSFFDKAGNALKTTWSYISTGRDYFWKGIRFTLATGIFLFVVISVVSSLISPLWQTSDEIDPEGKVVVFSPSGVVVDQEPVSRPSEWYEEALNDSLGGFGAQPTTPRLYEYRMLMKFFDDFKNDDRVTAMIFDPTGLGINPAYALPLARKIKETVDSGKEIVVRGFFFNDTTYMIASGASEISSKKISSFDIDGFGGAAPYYKNFFEKFLITPRIFTAGGWKTGPEQFTRDSMSEEEKENSKYIFRWWDKYKEFVLENRDVDLQWVADESYQDLISGKTKFANSALEWGLIDVMEETEDFDKRMIEKFGASEDDEEELNAVYFRDYLASFEEELPSKSKNVVRVITAEGTVAQGDITYGWMGSAGIKKMFEDAVEDENTKAIVLRVNSGGGLSISADYMRMAIQKAKDKGIPLVTSMGFIAASGGYSISSPAEKIFAEEDAIVGSIGAYLTAYSFEKIYDWLGINTDGFSTTKYGAFDEMAQDWPEDIVNIFQASLDEGYEEFVTTVSEDRNLPMEQVLDLAQGKVYLSDQALELGLVDEIGTLEDAIAYAAEDLAELEDYRVMYVTPPMPSANPFEFKLEFSQYPLINLIVNNTLNREKKSIQAMSYDNIYKYCFECEFTD